MNAGQGTDPHSAYWNDRFLQHGHTGWNKAEIYRYDQKVRIRAILETLSTLGIECRPGLRVLDVGCGTGDIAEALAARGAEVVGYDISPSVIDWTTSRLQHLTNVVFESANVVDAEIKHGPFDVIVSVTVLQHQVDDRDLSTLIRKLARSLKPSGHIVILETVLPEGASRTEADHYIRPRTRAEWVEHFRRCGLHLEYERSYPQSALSTLAWLRRVRRNVRSGNGTPAVGESGTSQPRPLSRPKRVALEVYLGAFVPLDHWLRVPTPKRLGTGRILAFGASCRDAA